MVRVEEFVCFSKTLAETVVHFLQDFRGLSLAHHQLSQSCSFLGQTLKILDWVWTELDCLLYFEDGYLKVPSVVQLFVCLLLVLYWSLEEFEEILGLRQGTMWKVM